MHGGLWGITYFPLPGKYVCFTISYGLMWLISILSSPLEVLLSAWWFLFKPGFTAMVAKWYSSNPHAPFVFIGWCFTVSKSPFLFPVYSSIYYGSITHQDRFTNSNYFKGLLFLICLIIWMLKSFHHWLVGASSRWASRPSDTPPPLLGMLPYLPAGDAPGSSRKTRARGAGIKRAALTVQYRWWCVGNERWVII